VKAKQKGSLINVHFKGFGNEDQAGIGFPRK